jgi:histidinol-phosphate aminotransferase
VTSPDRGVVRLDLNESAAAPPARVLRAIRQAAARAHRYPDIDCAELRAAIAARHGIDPDMVLVGTGTSELVTTIALAHGRAGAVLTTRTWPLYGQVLNALDVPIRWVPLRGYELPVAGIEEALAGGAAWAMVCNPHNPCGTALAPADVERLLRAAAGGGGLAVFDEAYADFARSDAGSGLAALVAGGDCLVLRTFSKAFALAGMRVAYAMGPRARIAALRARLQPYRVGVLAQVAAVAALADAGGVRRAALRVMATRDRCAAALALRGFRCPPSDTNFLLVDVGADAAAVARGLVQAHGIAVADAGPLGFPGHVRVTVGTGPQMRELPSALAGVVEHIVAAVPGMAS